MSETTEPEMLLSLINGLRQAAGSAHQLAHSQQNPSWLSVRNLLEACREKCIVMASAKPMSRQDVLTALDVRQREIQT